MDAQKRFQLTPEEQAAEDLDRLMLEAARRANGPNAPSIMDLFPNAIPIEKALELHCWARSGRLGKVKVALNEGTDINTKDRFGQTALHAAAENGCLQVVRFLVESGADSTVLTDAGKTALQLAEARSKAIPPCGDIDRVVIYLRQTQRD